MARAKEKEMNPAESALAPVEPEVSEQPMSNLERLLKPREDPGRPLANSIAMRCAFLMLLVKEMKAAGNECWNDSIEHAVFVLMQLDDPGLGYEFYPSLLGPESKRLEMDMNALLDAGWATEGDCRDGLTLKVTEEGERFMEECPVTIGRCRSSVEKTVRIAGPKSNVELMMLATAMFLIRKTRDGREMSEPELVDYYLRTRRMSDRSEVRDRVDEALALLSKEPVKEPVHA